MPNRPKTMEGIPDKVSEANRMILTQRESFLYIPQDKNQQKSLWARLKEEHQKPE
ncbi:hypothetical protein SPAR40_2198 [Streptococcus pneumoniae GA16531]|nr:hypothetical protein SPAR40_2198 [Streptococcus pneumoniae GA16531]EHZ76227.1 hypothetical protein SPAR129_2049 [Streptococcus pneumoniae 7879-04]